MINSVEYRILVEILTFLLSCLFPLAWSLNCPFAWPVFSFCDFLILIEHCSSRTCWVNVPVYWVFKKVFLLLNQVVSSIIEAFFDCFLTFIPQDSTMHFCCVTFSIVIRHIWGLCYFFRLILQMLSLILELKSCKSLR